MSVRGFIKFAVTTGYIGNLKPFPGTLASAAALVLIFFLPDNGTPVLILFLATLIIGLACAKPAVEILGSKDPSKFVLDEWCGMALSVLYLPHDFKILAAAFVLFRIFDVLKPLGIRKIDRWNHPFAIVLDDVAAGLYANVFLRVLIKFFWPDF